MIQSELFLSKDEQSYFINCKVKGEILEVGAVYIAPSASSPMELVSQEGASLTVEIPENVANKPNSMVAADTSFYIVQ